jgi:hypothetical protein
MNQKGEQENERAKEREKERERSTRFDGKWSGRGEPDLDDRYRNTRLTRKPNSFGSASLSPLNLLCIDNEF